MSEAITQKKANDGSAVSSPTASTSSDPLDVQQLSDPLVDPLQGSTGILSEGAVQMVEGEGGGDSPTSGDVSATPYRARQTLKYAQKYSAEVDTQWQALNGGGGSRRRAVEALEAREEKVQRWAERVSNGIDAFAADGEESVKAEVKSTLKKAGSILWKVHKRLSGHHGPEYNSSTMRTVRSQIKAAGGKL